MNWEAIGAIGEIIGALAVFITLAYLAIQIRQNTKTVQASALDSSMNGISAIREKIIESPEVSDLFLKGNTDPDSLSDSESLRFRMLYTNIYWSALNLYNQSKYAEISENIWDCQRPVILRMLDPPGGRWFWKNYRNEFEESFAREIDQILDSRLRDDDT